ncbi:MAG: archaetidylserine decarboxylase [Succinivibrionaceae bacterium]
MELLKVLLHHLTPKYILTCIAGFFANKEMGDITTSAIQFFAKKYNVNMREAEIEDFYQYKTFNEFFTRKLKNGIRPIYGDNSNLCMPVDGTMAEFGDISFGRLIAAKGQDYSLRSLLGGSEDIAKEFKDGQFACIYLSPTDYHRIHMPITGKLKKMIFIPGKYYSVNPTYVKHIDDLFTKNERVVCIFDTACGPMSMVLVGATIVGSIITTWAGTVAPSKIKEVKTWDYVDGVTIKKGEEMGRFQLGSTVIMTFPKDAIKFANFTTNQKVKMGSHFADIVNYK